MLIGKEILLLGIPTILQIGLTAMRLKGRTRMPISITFILSLILGILLSMYLSNKASNIYGEETAPHEYGIRMLTLISTLPWVFFSTIMIGLIGGLLYRDKIKQSRKLMKDQH